MPQLPGGRHVAITASPLYALLVDAGSPRTIHAIMAMKSRADLNAYIELIFLVPESEASESARSTAFNDKSLPRPPGLVPVPSGFRLSDWDALTADWDEADKLALREFLDGRAAHIFDTCMAELKRVQQALLASPDFGIRLIAGCWAGTEVAMPSTRDLAPKLDLPSFDSYDMLAALGQVVELLANNRAAAEQLGAAYQRLATVWRMLRTNYPMPTDWPALDQSPSDCAMTGRSTNFLSAVSEGAQTWLFRQCVTECVCLWDAYGDAFATDYPAQYAIIELVVVSPHANECFDRGVSSYAHNPSIH